MTDWFKKSEKAEAVDAETEAAGPSDSEKESASFTICWRCKFPKHEHSRPEDWFVVIGERIMDLCPDCKYGQEWPEQHWAFDREYRILTFLYVVTLKTDPL